MGSWKGGVAMKQSQLALQVARPHLPPYLPRSSPNRRCGRACWTIGDWRTCGPAASGDPQVAYGALMGSMVMGGPAPGPLGPGGSGRPREPVSVASAVGPGGHPASVGRCRLRFRAYSSMAPAGAGYGEHHPGRARTPYRRRMPGNTVDVGWPRRSLRSSSGKTTRRGWPQVQQTLLLSAGRFGSGHFFASLGSSALPRGSTALQHPHSHEVFDGAPTGLFIPITNPTGHPPAESDDLKPSMSILCFPYDPQNGTSRPLLLRRW